ncbi:alpha/beta fold hydrolase [Mangrovivirga sp. M17]|uniref:Alpha/beta fold hydrolase n=1 Tax=Mangrovivirga halotolerans TaxID=2993936 RepID=A0ABT3RWG6_9BACT|nr:alpha/beta fold hydrolase [Mangrovivirga halotolerans]MCX2745678.1 alpha/beta fold hydrolase [Mangrovivirga halotolerans]
MIRVLLFILILFPFTFISGQTEKVISITRDSLDLTGTLLLPETSEKDVLVIITPGSGPVNQDGNMQMMQTSYLKVLAEELAKEGFASFRYNKRSIALLESGKISELITFDDFINDLEAWSLQLDSLMPDHEQVLLGHSQGGLVSMVVAAREKAKVKGVISLCGQGYRIDKVLMEQLEPQGPGILKLSRSYLDTLIAGDSIRQPHLLLKSIFNPQAQYFIKTWLKYDPSEVIKQIDVPVLLIAGTKDLQVKPEQLKDLSKKSKNAEYKEIEDMNHVLKEIEGGYQQNLDSYFNEGPLHDMLIPVLTTFIKKEVK